MIAPKPTPDEQVELIIRNAQLRDELEPLFDESIGCVNVEGMPTHRENEFLASMLEWERAPMVPIRDWFDPPLALPSPDALEPEQLSALLASTVEALFGLRVVLDFTDHLTDRQLYTIIYRDILPSYEKKIDRRESYLHWDCANIEGDPDAWLRYYATHEERETWRDETGGDLPPSEEPPYARRLPKAPL